MAKQHEIIIPGPPIPMQRPRFSRGRTYNPQAELKKAMQLIVRSQYRGQALEGPIKAVMRFEMPIPKSMSKKKAAALVGKPHIIKSDLDNILKFYLDVMNAIVFKDDSQVYIIETSKIYSITPKATIMIEMV